MCDRYNSLEVLFVSSVCSTDKYSWVVKQRIVSSLDPYQRLFSAFVEGLSANGCHVTCISALPLSISNCSISAFSREEESVESVDYIYPAFRMGRLSRIHDLFRNTKIEIIKWYSQTKGKRRIIICDSLVLMCSNPCRKYMQRKRLPVIAYVTDYPSLATSIKKQSKKVKALCQKLFDTYADNDLKKYNGYILVADALKEKIGIWHKPYIVLEDIISIKNLVLKNNSKNKKFTIIYGGALCTRFGVEILADAVHMSTNQLLSLEFYGSGESVEYIKLLSQKDNRIRWRGIVTYGELQKIQANADLLVNPRPSNETFSAYSFPSKTLSYMLTGTPVLSTRIPGIPKDYDEYLLWFDGESAAEMDCRIREVISLGSEKLIEIGAKAKQYAIHKKNPVVQTRRILDFVVREFLM